MTLICSACLLGEACRYDGAAKTHEKVLQEVALWRADGGRVVPVCPEELGELGTPRPACELSGGDGAAFWQGTAEVVEKETRHSQSVAFGAGAKRALAKAVGAKKAILKARSPSCGCGKTWIDGKLQNGDGVFAARLRALGIPLTTEEDL